MTKANKTTAFMVASIFLASVLILVVGVLALTSGTQTTGFSMTYVASNINATIVATGENYDSPIDMNGAEAGTTHTANITSGTTNQAIPSPTINNGNAVEFQIGSQNRPQPIYFYFEVTSTGDADFVCALTTSSESLSNATITYAAGELTPAAYTKGDNIFFMDADDTITFGICIEVEDMNSNASASGNFVLTFSQPPTQSVANATQLTNLVSETSAGSGIYNFGNKNTLYKLTDDITISTTPKLGRLLGSFDGNGHTITITGADQPTGIFERVGDYDYVEYQPINNFAKLKNLNVVFSDASITSYEENGLVLDNYGTIENCSVGGNIFSSSDCSGICGCNVGIIKNCYNTADITVNMSAEDNSEAYAGGICIYNEGIIDSCYNTGSIAVVISGGVNTEAYVGGICGVFYGSIINCYNSGVFYGSIINCYNTGEISAQAANIYAGGIVGKSFYISSSVETASVIAMHADNLLTSSNANAGRYNYNGSTIQNCYNLGSVSAVGTAVRLGAIVGHNHYSTITNNYFVSNCGVSFGIGYDEDANAGSNSGTTSFLYNSEANYLQSTFDFAFDEYGVWIWKENTNTVINGTSVATADLPHLKFQYGIKPTPLPFELDGVYTIATAAQFNLYARYGYFLNRDNSFVQTANITSSNALYLSDLYAPYDGGGYSITITGADQRDAIFNYVNGDAWNGYFGSVENLNVTINDCVSTDYNFCGGIVRHLSDGTIANCSFAGAIESTATYTGGIVGYFNKLFTISPKHGNLSKTSNDVNSSIASKNVFAKMKIIEDISNCHNSANITVNSSADNTNCGGIAGYSSGGNIDLSYNTGTITGNSTGNEISCGGIVGETSYGRIINSYNTSDVTSEGPESYAGGICGKGLGSISDCNNTGLITATSTSSSAYAGGIWGYGNVNVNNCYNTSLIIATSADGFACAGGIYGDCYTPYSADIINCYNTGNVTANANFSAYAGGICGTTNSNLDILNCYNTGSVTATGTSSSVYAGGISGYCYYGTITNCYNLGIVTAPTGTTKNIGGISGRSGTCSDNYWASNTASFGVGTGTGTGYDTGAMPFTASGTHSYTQGTFAEWTFGTYGTATDGWVWGASKSMIINGITYNATSLPRLYWEEL